MKVHFIIIPNELKDGDVKAAGEGDTVLLDANGVIFDVLTPIQKKMESVLHTFKFHIIPAQMVKIPLHLKVTCELCRFVIYFHSLICS